MSKKSNKNSKSEVVSSTSENIVQNTEQSDKSTCNESTEDGIITVSKDFMKDAKLCIDEKYLEEHTISLAKEYGGLNNMSLFDLVQLEKACALLCKRFETSARLDRENNEKFKEYKGYYDKIFSELEKRVSEVCK